MSERIPFPAESVLAPVSDTEFRTYVLLCTLAWQHHPEANPPYVELTYAELAEKHPRLVAVSTLRVRVMALVKHGFLRREQVGRSVWRTYITGLAPLPPEDDNRKALSIQLADRAGKAQMVVRQRPSPTDRLMQVEPDRPTITLGKPSANGVERDRATITLPDRPANTQEKLSASSSAPTQSSALSTSSSPSWGDMIRLSMDVLAALEGDPDAVPMGKPPKDRTFNFDPVLNRGRNRERLFFDTRAAGGRQRIADSTEPDRETITFEKLSVRSEKPDRSTITLAPNEGDRPVHTLDNSEGDRAVITLVEGDRPDSTLGDPTPITHEPDRPTITLGMGEGDRSMITLAEGDRPDNTQPGEGDRPDNTQVAEGDRPVHTLAAETGRPAPSRAHAYARTRAHADQDQITDLTDPDLIKRSDLKNKKSDQDQIHRFQVRAREARPNADDDPYMAAFRRTGNVVPMGAAEADPDFSFSAKTGREWEQFARADLSEADPDFVFSAWKGEGGGSAGYGVISDWRTVEAASSTLEVKALSQKPSASRFGQSAPQSAASDLNHPGRPASKNPSLKAAQATVAAPTTSPRSASKEPNLTAPQAPNAAPMMPIRQASKNPPLTAPQASVAVPKSPARPASKKPSLTAAPSLESILSHLDPSYHQLAHDLLALKPEPMDLKGLAEVMAKPELTAAWFAWATDPANGVRKPAAYLRSMVRKGYFPPPRPGDEPETPKSTVDADGVDRSNPNYDVWPGGFTVGKGEIFDIRTYVHPSRRDDLVWP